MKSNFTHFLQQSFRALMPVVTAVCLSVGAEATAQEDIQNNPDVQPVEEAEKVTAVQGEPSPVTEEIESLRTEEVKKIEEMLGKASDCSQKEEY